MTKMAQQFVKESHNFSYTIHSLSRFYRLLQCFLYSEIPIIFFSSLFNDLSVSILESNAVFILNNYKGKDDYIEMKMFEHGYLSRNFDFMLHEICR
jgi:hypothetical protein